MNNAQLINQTSLTVEHYTPPEIIALVHQMWGEDGIDFDPASSPVANQTVRARVICTAPKCHQIGVTVGLPLMNTDDRGGLDVGWHGRVWLNHPFGQPVAPCKTDCVKASCRKRGYHVTHGLPGSSNWINKFLAEYRVGRMEEGISIQYAATSEAWFRPLHNYARCWIYGRTNYMDADGRRQMGATKGSCLVYVGRRWAEFQSIFSDIGRVDLAGADWM